MAVSVGESMEFFSWARSFLFSFTFSKTAATEGVRREGDSGVVDEGDAKSPVKKIIKPLASNQYKIDK